MIYGIGVDLIEVGRIQRALDRFGDRFIKRIYDQAELRFSRDYEGYVEGLAARFAGKEAVMKALGTGRRGVRWREIRILNEPSGRPYVSLIGKTAALAKGRGVGQLYVSMSHSGGMAIAQVVALLEGVRGF